MAAPAPTTTTAPPSVTPTELPPAPTDPATITAQDTSLVFPSFDASTAWTLGSLLRHKLLSFPSATCISITLANGTPLFFNATKPGTTPDNASWVARKQATVLRFGCSTWFMSRKFEGDEGAFAAKYGLAGEKAGGYAIHGGGWPVRVKGVEGVVAVVVVSGLKQDQDHMVVVATVREYLAGLGELTLEEGEKRKED
ncbi:hypothetical protein AAFC00_000191 [Neodothiora populina]|uniref:DUF967 domain protein n=1 Tax=Neodothiora populina TaxID=2781224 RepID=A0ABR3P314_9PEZI